MQYLSSTEAKETFGAVVAKAQQEPVIICNQNREVAILLSMQDYEQMKQLNLKQFQQFRERMGRIAQECGLTEDKLNEMLSEHE